jgi:hypothetical protein
MTEGLRGEFLMTDRTLSDFRIQGLAGVSSLKKFALLVSDCVDPKETTEAFNGVFIVIESKNRWVSAYNELALNHYFERDRKADGDRGCVRTELISRVR